jgi:hypothetical protein
MERAIEDIERMPSAVLRLSGHSKVFGVISELELKIRRHELEVERFRLEESKLNRNPLQGRDPLEALAAIAEWRKGLPEGSLRELESRVEEEL